MRQTQREKHSERQVCRESLGSSYPIAPGMEQFPSHPEEVPTHPGTTVLPKPCNPLVSEVQRALSGAVQALSMRTRAPSSCSIQRPFQDHFPLWFHSWHCKRGKTLGGGDGCFPKPSRGGVTMGFPFWLDLLGTVLIHGQVVTLVKLSPAAPYSVAPFTLGPCNVLLLPSVPPETPS